MLWVNLAVKPYFSWPSARVDFMFEGKRVTLMPSTEDLACTISVFDQSGLSFEEGGGLLCRFLSRLAWSMGAGVTELFYTGSNDPARPGRLGRGTYGESPAAQVAPWEFVYLPQPSSANAELALALFREGMSINSVPFALLSYFKVINLLNSDWKKQVEWINQNLVRVRYEPAKTRLTELQNLHTDLGQYLYVSGRCAVAHAFGSPIANPDRYEDKKRLELDLPLMKELAEVCIEQEFGVMSDSAFWAFIRKTHNHPPELLRKALLSDGSIQYGPQPQRA